MLLSLHSCSDPDPIAAHFNAQRAGDNQEYFHSVDTAVRGEHSDDTTQDMYLVECVPTVSCCMDGL